MYLTSFVSLKNFISFKAISKEIAYIGDDLNDLDCMNYCSCTACPADAVEEVLKVAGCICKHKGGQGAVREFVSKR